MSYCDHTTREEKLKCLYCGEAEAIDVAKEEEALRKENLNAVDLPHTIGNRHERRKLAKLTNKARRLT